MSHESIKAAFSDAVNLVASNISRYVINPDKDLTRNRKIGAVELISFMVSCGSSSTRLELLDFFGLVPDSPSASAFNQQRAKLKPDALEAVFHQFDSSVLSMGKTPDEFRAFCDMVDRHALPPDTKDVFIGDRGYCSYNNMAHVIEKD